MGETENSIPSPQETSSRVGGRIAVGVKDGSVVVLVVGGKAAVDDSGEDNTRLSVSVESVVLTKLYVVVFFEPQALKTTTPINKSTRIHSRNPHTSEWCDILFTVVTPPQFRVTRHNGNLEHNPPSQKGSQNFEMLHDRQLRLGGGRSCG
jgi:hypothetical protein